MSKLEFSQWVNEFGQVIHRVHAKTPLSEKGAIGFVHGMGGYIEAYQRVFDFYLKNGYSVYGFDSYGHGRSEGQRGHIHSQAQWLNEIQMLIQWMRFQTHAPIVLYGHSLGGLKALLYLIKGSIQPDLAVASSPLVQQTDPESILKIYLGTLLSYVWPRFVVSTGIDEENNPQRGIQDALDHGDISLKMARIMFRSIKDLQGVHWIDPPLLLQHGSADLLTSYEATKALSEQWRGDIMFYPWEGCSHELHNSINRLSFFEKTLAWMNAKIHR